MRLCCMRRIIYYTRERVSLSLSRELRFARKGVLFPLSLLILIPPNVKGGGGRGRRLLKPTPLVVVVGYQGKKVESLKGINVRDRIALCHRIYARVVVAVSLDATTTTRTRTKKGRTTDCTISRYKTTYHQIPPLEFSLFLFFFYYYY